MKIGVMSDSHDHMGNVSKVIDYFLSEKVDKIVHCGDMVAPFIVRSMAAIEELNKSEVKIECIGVYGNNDGEKVGIKKILGKVMDVKGDFYETEWNGYKIAIYHGTDARILENLIDSGHYALILTGHTHQIRIEKRGNTLIVNPGETCGYLTGKATCAIVDLPENQAKDLDHTSEMVLYEKNVIIHEL